MHYDLLTIAYLAHITADDTALREICNIIKQSGITGMIANLYFMSKDEMIQELDPNYYQDDVSVSKMFEIATRTITKYLPNIDLLYSIEGCDYIRGVEELELLYNLGLRSILLVWNNQNKYGSGIRGDGGLTKEGIDFINKAIDLNIGIDLSHANEETFMDIIDLVKRSTKKPICYASHSNVRSLCNRVRNLSDNELKALKEIDGFIGVVSYPPFISNDKDISNEQLIDKYVEMLKYCINYFGENYVILSTDDMFLYKYYCPKYYIKSLFDYSNLKSNIYDVLKEKFNEETIEKVMIKNAKEKIFDNLK